MKKLILFTALLLAIYLVVRQNLVGTETATTDESLEDLSKEEKVRALDELKVLYPKTNKKTKTKTKTAERPKRVEKPFYKGEKDDFDRLEKVQYLDERGNPVNLNEEGEP